MLLRAILIAALSLSVSSALANVVISLQATNNMSCADGVCVPTARNAVLNVRDLMNLLASGNVEVTTTGSKVQAGNILLNAKLSWSTTNTLALNAYRSIAIGNAVIVAGSGGLTVVTNNGGSNGTFSFTSKGQVNFRNLDSPLIINGVSFVLVNSLPRLAAAVANNSAGAYALSKSYDASKDGTYENCPISMLDGTIEGLGNTISNLSIDIGSQDADDGLVDFVNSGALIENLRLTHIRYQASSPDYNAAGGLVAQNYGALIGDEASGTIDSTGHNEQVAELAGYSSPASVIYQATANVNVSGEFCSCGGLVGLNYGAIEFSSAKGTVSGADAGGLVGQNLGPISQSFATGAAGGDYAGGLIGANTYDGTNTGTASNSYATGNVSGGNAGGFVGDEQDGTLSEAYSMGVVQSGGGGFGCTGGEIQVSYDYWDTTTSGAAYGWCFELNVDGTNGLTTKQLQKKLPVGFSKKIWALDPKINNGFPYLIANPPVKE